MKLSGIYLVAAILCLGLTGCQSAQQADRPIFTPPDDFSLDITVLSGDPNASFGPVHFRNSRYIVFPDGTLHASFGEELSANDYPVYVRKLDTRIVVALWRMIADAGLNDPEEADPVGNIELINKQDGQMTYLICVTTDDNQLIVGRSHPVGENPDPAIHSITRTLAYLAWVNDDPDLSAFRIPQRYDFGPDPYAKYRNNTDQSNNE